MAQGDPFGKPKWEWQWTKPVENDNLARFVSEHKALEANELEPFIMDAWHIVDDLKVLYARTDYLDMNEVQNILLGLTSLYQIKFEMLFEAFEKTLIKK